MQFRNLIYPVIFMAGMAFGAGNEPNDRELFLLNYKAGQYTNKKCEDANSIKKRVSELEEYYSYLNDPDLSEKILKVEKFNTGRRIIQDKSSLRALTDCNDADLEKIVSFASELKKLCPELAREGTQVYCWTEPNVINEFKKTCFFSDEKEVLPVFSNFYGHSRISEYFGKEPPPIEFKSSLNFGFNKERFTGKLDFREYKGSVVLVNFFTEWCGPCKEEMPYLQKISEKYQGKVKVIGVCCNPDRNFWGYPNLEKVIEENKITYPVLVFSKNYGEDNYKVTGWPQSFLIGKDGKVISGRSSIQEELSK
ncbi:MAG: TlpA disulfide reductase family protein [Candidatus Nanoarchaeia archaeon]|nr:TlpA disulfide reductase family protein [Candidatus Nanoarchaeia archaeon]MDD5740431.1 TlpA disulfide reductase family protein [Candidatus Nanoarchaeia archaeon]